MGAYDGEINAYGDVGYVRLYDKDGTDWNMIQQINGTVDRGYFGGSVDLSHDGSTLTISSLYNNGSKIIQSNPTPVTAIISKCRSFLLKFIKVCLI